MMDYIELFFNPLPDFFGTISLWNHRLRTAVAMLKSNWTNKNSKYLFHEPDGSSIEPQRFAGRFKDCMRRRAAAGKITPEERFTFHDMKAKGVSDHEEQYSGHKTEEGRKVYIRKAPKIKGSIVRGNIVWDQGRVVWDLGIAA